MPRLFLHIGSHKTGTTTIQHTFAHNAARMRDQDFAWVAGPNQPNLHEFLVYGDRKQILPQGFRAGHPEVLAQALAVKGVGNVIGSSENFSFFFQPEAIQELAEALKSRFDEIRIICYLRRQDRHAVSHHQEGAKPHREIEGALWGHATRALPRAHANQRLYLDYDQRLGMWAGAFGAENLDIAVFDRALLKNGDVVDDFMARVGLQKDGLVTIADRNISLGAAQSKLGHLMNEALDDPAMAGAILARVPNEGKLMPARAEAMTFLEPYRDSNRRLNARFKISDLPDLFNDDFSDYPEASAEGWTEDSANDTFRAMFGAIRNLDETLLSLAPNDLRLGALALRAENPEAALRLIRAAHAMRPNGPAIVKLRAELERRVANLAR